MLCFDRYDNNCSFFEEVAVLLLEAAPAEPASEPAEPVISSMRREIPTGDPDGAGDCVGDADGDLSVGAGDSVGVEDGASASVGDVDGTVDGTSDGESDGIVDGESDGIVDGMSDGTTDGISDGTPDLDNCVGKMIFVNEWMTPLQRTISGTSMRGKFISVFAVPTCARMLSGKHCVVVSPRSAISVCPSHMSCDVNTRPGVPTTWYNNNDVNSSVVSGMKFESMFSNATLSGANNVKSWVVSASTVSSPAEVNAEHKLPKNSANSGSQTKSAVFCCCFRFVFVFYVYSICTNRGEKKKIENDELLIEQTCSRSVNDHNAIIDDRHNRF